MGLRASWHAAVLRAIGEGIVTTDTQGIITWMNPQAERFGACRPKQAKGRPLADVFPMVHVRTREQLPDFVGRVVREGKPLVFEDTILIGQDGTEYEIAVSAAPILGSEGDVLGVVLVFRDLTEEYEQRRQLAISRRRFQGLYHGSLNGIATHNIVYGEEGSAVDFRFVSVNAAFERMTGLAKEQVLGRLYSHLLHGQSQYSLHKFQEAVRSGSSLDFQEYYAALDKYFSIRVFSPRADLLVAVFSEITAAKKLEMRLREQAFRDSLTGLYNRRFFEEELARLGADQSRYPLSLIMGDVNGLKIINDSLGHQQGDRVLQTLADILQKISRPGDVVARWGGDEFVLLLPNTAEDASQALAQAIDGEIKTIKPDGPVPSTGLGCATAVDFPADLSRLLKEAEDHMYSHKLINADSSRNALVASLQRTLSERSYETEEHARNLEQLARQLGGRLGLNAAQLNTLALIALLHDIGKVAVPEHILEKPGPLRPEEWKIMKRHCKSGYRIVISSPDLIDVAEGILSHHERWDGSGYPRGLAGEEIPLLARIISLVDAYDAMTSDRPYRAAMTHAEALAEIKACSGTQFDPLLAREFLGMLCPVNEKNPG